MWDFRGAAPPRLVLPAAAKSPEEICRLFQRYMAEGNLEALLNIYDAEAVFLNQSAELKRDRHGLRG